MSSSASPRDPWRRAISLRHSSVCTVSGAADFNAAASAEASSAIVLLQLHSFRVLCWIAIVVHSCRRLLFLPGSFFFCRLHQPLARPLQAREHLRRYGIGPRVVVDVGIETVHDVEARIRKELLQRRALDAFLDLRAHERLEVGLEREAVQRRKLRGGCRFAGLRGGRPGLVVYSGPRSPGSQPY